jgi:hypothetical protein
MSIDWFVDPDGTSIARRLSPRSSRVEQPTLCVFAG